MPEATTGSCGCGALHFTVTGKIRNVVNCHCSKCRKFSGAAFSSYAVIGADAFELTAGETELARFVLPGGTARHFCSCCGTPVFLVNPVYPAFRMLPLGILERPEELEPRMNIFCSTQLDWLGHLAELPSFSGPFRR
jgi:hypothetical protein